MDASSTSTLDLAASGSAQVGVDQAVYDDMFKAVQMQQRVVQIGNWALPLPAVIQLGCQKEPQVNEAGNCAGRINR